MNIPKLSNSNYDEILQEASSVPQDLLRKVFKDIISFMPYKNEIMSDFILDLKNNENVEENLFISLLKDLLHSNDLFILISSVVYSKRLGFNLNFSEFKISPIENKINFSKFFLEMNEVDKIKILEFLERIKVFIFEYEKVKFGDEEFFIYFFCISIIKNFKFSVKECVNELRSTAEDQIIISSIIICSTIMCGNGRMCRGMVVGSNGSGRMCRGSSMEMTDKEPSSPNTPISSSSSLNIVYLTSILLKIINLENYEMVLEGFPFMEKDFRDFLIAMIHENYLNLNFNNNNNNNFNNHILPFNKKEDLIKIKEFVDDLTLDVLSKFTNLENLIQFLPEFKEKIEIPLIKTLPKEKFKISNEKDKFFEDFCLLGSPSVSHFLSYLEIYKKEFKLRDDEQKMFLEVFNRIFIKRKSFKGIVLGKMVKFGIIKNDLI